MAGRLKSDFEDPRPAPSAPSPPRSREQRRIERQLNRQALRREEIARREARHIARVGFWTGDRKLPAAGDDGPGYLGWRVRGLLMKWYGTAPEHLPVLVIDRRYWEARCCGFDALDRDEHGRPCGEPASWWPWWCRLHPAQREQLIGLSRKCGFQRADMPLRVTADRPGGMGAVARGGRVERGTRCVVAEGDPAGVADCTRTPRGGVTYDCGPGRLPDRLVDSNHSELEGQVAR